MTSSRLLLVAAVVLAAGQATLAQRSFAPPPIPVEERIGGTWTSGRDSGVYRIVIARSGDRPEVARLFVQWVKGDPAAPEVRNSVEVTEISAQGLDVSRFTMRPESDGLVVHVMTRDPATGAEDEYEILVDQPGKYAFRRSAN